MLQRITALEDPRLPRVLRLRAALDALPLSGAGLPRVSIGRADGTTFRLGCSTDFPVVVSRHHASVSFDGEDFRLEDDDACNGTYVRARRAAQTRGPCLSRSTRARAPAAPLGSATQLRRHDLRAARAASQPGRVCSVRCASPYACPPCVCLGTHRVGPARAQVNEVALPHHGSQALRVGDVVSFGGAATVRRARKGLFRVSRAHAPRAPRAVLASGECAP